MQILGKRSKVLLIAVAITMLVAIGISFAMWDNMSVVKASNGSLSDYANAKVGDIVEFGRYYQTGNRINNDENAEYEKTPIEWIVVDKDERTGQLTLMSKYILASGSYFANYYYNSNNWDAHYDNNTTIADIPYNQAYVDSTVRAYLNNLERLDLGGDGFTSGIGYVPSMTNSTSESGLLSSVGFSNQRYWTGLNVSNDDNNALVNSGSNGLYKRHESNNEEIYYQRPISNIEYKSRPATRGFLDEAFTNEEKTLIIPKAIAGYTGHRWPDATHDIALKSYIEGANDKVWLPSATELNIMQGVDWSEHENDAWTNPSDEAGSTAFEYFKNFQNYGYQSVTDAVKARRTEFAKNSFAMNYSIPVYKKGSTEINTDIHSTNNSTDHYWTRSPMSYLSYDVRLVYSSGVFHAWHTYASHVGVRPCVILKY